MGRIWNGLTLWITLTIAAIAVTGTTADVADITNLPLELQPPVDTDFSAARDSYGNPIDTPDGRKVVSAQGVQFEIPNYASGISEVRKPSDDLLPPLVATDSVAPSLPATAPVEENPFKATLPPWLADFNDPDVGPGVPFVAPKDGPSSPAGPASQPPTVFSPPTNAPQTAQAPTFKPFTFQFGTAFNKPVSQKPAIPTAAPPTTRFPTFKPFTSTFGSSFNAFPSFQPTQKPFQQTTQTANRFTGTFGGAPGVLGQQQVAGFAVRPSAPRPTAAPVSVTTTFGHKYTGGFGGPPGVLVPFDNVKSR